MKVYHDTVNSITACIKRGYLDYEPSTHHKEPVIEQGTGYYVVMLQGTYVVYKIQ